MITINAHEAKTRLSALLQKVEKEGETILVCRSGHPVAEIHAVGARRKKGLPKPHADLAAVLHYDPTETATADEWPENCR